MLVECNNTTAHSTDEEFVEQTWTDHAVATEDGLFCGQLCAKQAEDDRYFRNACEDRDSWYWDNHTPSWDTQFPSTPYPLDNI